MILLAFRHCHAMMVAAITPITDIYAAAAIFDGCRRCHAAYFRCTAAYYGIIPRLLITLRCCCRRCRLR